MKDVKEISFKQLIYLKKTNNLDNVLCYVFKSDGSGKIKKVQKGLKRFEYSLNGESLTNIITELGKDHYDYVHIDDCAAIDIGDGVCWFYLPKNLKIGKVNKLNKKYYFQISSEDNCIYITPKEYYDVEGCLDDQNSEKDICNVLEEIESYEESESIFSLPTNISIDSIKTFLKTKGLIEYNLIK